MVLTAVAAATKTTTRNEASGRRLIQNLGLDPGEAVGPRAGVEVPVGQDELVEAELGVLTELIDQGGYRAGEGRAARRRGSVKVDEGVHRVPHRGRIPVARVAGREQRRA